MLLLGEAERELALEEEELQNVHVDHVDLKLKLHSGHIPLQEF